MPLTAAALERRLDRVSSRFRPLPKVMPSALELAEKAGFRADDWQRDVLVSRSNRLLLNCSRQSGKSTVVAVLAASTALSQPGALVLLVSPTLRQSSELFRAARRVYVNSGGPALVPSTSETALTLTLRNGSRIVSLPGTEGHVRGYSNVALLAVDEASRVPDELFAAILPMLATSGGRLVALSTPWGKRGFFWQAWSGGDDWQKVLVKAEDCPRIPASFLAEARATLGDFWFRQEFQCEFLDADSAAFATADIERAFAGSVATWAL